MDVHDVEAVVREVEGVDIADLEGDIADSLVGGQAARLLQWLRCVFHSCNVALGCVPCEVHADGPWAAAEVENGHGRFDVWLDVWD